LARTVLRSPRVLALAVDGDPLAVDDVGHLPGDLEAGLDRAEPLVDDAVEPGVTLDLDPGHAGDAGGDGGDVVDQGPDLVQGELMRALRLNSILVLLCSEAARRFHRMKPY
jgi:hypothetical protein